MDGAADGAPLGAAPRPLPVDEAEAADLVVLVVVLA